MIRYYVLTLSALLILPTLLVAAQPDNVVVTPEETNEILANPGMGWETFGVPAKLDKSLPDWIPSTVYYTRWGWASVEPQPGKLDTEMLDYALKQAHDSGQKLAFRVSCCSNRAGEPTHPAWLTEVGGRELQARYNRYPSVMIPDMDDAIVLERHLDFIKRLGKRYDGHSDLDHIDLGSIGWFGEWHLTSNGHSLMPSMETRMKVVKAYLGAFKKTPVLMLLNGGDCLAFATHHGAGWRADCLGDMGGFSRHWSHMRQGYPSWIQKAECLDTWKTSPVAWESCWNMQKWVNEGWPLRYIFNYALALHASYLNNKSAPLPEGPEVRPETERFLRRLGYRLVLKELKYPATAKAGGSFALTTKWQNIGSAPCYRPYRLAYRFSNDSGYKKVFVGKTTVNHWLPGSVEVFTPEFFRNPPDLPPGDVVSANDTVSLPADVPSGQYSVSLAVVDQSEKPVVRLAIKGRVADGWYPLGKVTVSR
jgi:hypothetical protein